MAERQPDSGDVFQQEASALDTFSRQIEAGDVDATQLAAFAKNYGKLLKTARRLVRVADRNESELRRARAEADDANKAKAQFLAAMSHEIRTPMNGVVGMIDVLQRTSLDPDQTKMASTIRESAFSLLHIINDILDFSKIEAGKLELEIIPVDLLDLIEGVVQTILPNATAKSLTLDLFVDPSVPGRIKSDPVRLRQILFNLVGNAIKFTEAPGLVRLTVRSSSPKDDDNEAMLRFDVEDSGIGIAPEALSTLFEPFTQAEGSTTRRFGGTGLGLTISRNLCDLMGGEISATSRPGEGSTFTVALPCESVEPDVDEDRVGRLSGVSVHVAVEDERLRGMVAGYLEGAAAVIVDANDGAVLISGASTEANLVISRVGSGIAEAGLSATPLLPSVLIDRVAVAAGLVDEDHQSNADKPSARALPTIDEAERSGLLILVAEDNTTNQDVIRRQLALLGYVCEIADDGLQAQEMLAHRRYGVLLTDCHMPHVDGYQLTEAIRGNETGNGSRLPIIAITASALQGEAEKCLAAGMDDYLTKPLEMDKLADMLATWLPDASDEAPWRAIDGTSAKDHSPDTINDEDGASVDLSALIQIFGEEESLLREILADFVAPSAEIVDAIVAASASGDLKTVGAEAHKLKSSARAIGASELADICAELEIAGKSEDTATVERLRTAISPAFARVRAFIESY